LPVSEKVKLVKAEEQFRAGDYAGAQAALDDIISRYPKYNETASAYYLRAHVHERSSRLAPATQDVQHCIALSKDPKLTALAHAMAGGLLFDAGNSDAARAHFERAMTDLPDEPPMDVARYRYGICLQRAGQWKQARQQFAAVSQRYAGQPIAERARRLYDWPHEFFSIQCGAFREHKPANEMSGRLRKARLNGWVHTQTRAGTKLYTVYCGRYPDYEQAKQGLVAARRVVSDAHVVP
jgi:tetratricopeptide (TPR) repeat protein